MEMFKLILYCTVVFGMMIILIFSFVFGLFWLIKFIVQKTKKGAVDYVDNSVNYR